MRYTTGVGTYFGIPVRVHATFPLILVAYAGVAWWQGSWPDALWAMALILAVFACVVLHELGHSLQVRRYGVMVRDIILFPIGGVARAEAIPENPRHEIAVAIAGPVVNFAIAALLFGVLALLGTPPHGDGFLVDLAWINLGLGLFNLVPAFPMDGGRILRGAFSLRVPYLAATRRARDVGQLLALGFLVAAFVDTSFVMLAVIAALVFVGGMYEERMVATRLRLGARPVGDLADTTARVFAASDRIDAVVPRLRVEPAPAYAIAGDSGSLAGVVTSADVLGALRAGRASESLASIARFDFPVADARTEAGRVFRHLHEVRQPFAAVVEGDRFIGLFHADETLRDFPRGVNIP